MIGRKMYPSEARALERYYFAPGKCPEVTIHDYMREGNVGNEAAIAFDYLGVRISYGKLFRMAKRTAHALAAHGVGHGGRSPTAQRPQTTVRTTATCAVPKCEPQKRMEDIMANAGKAKRVVTAVMAMATALALVICMAVPAAADAAVTASGATAKSAAKTTKKSAAFTIKKYAKTYNYNGYKGIYRYDLPILKGNSKAAKSINKSLKRGYTDSVMQKRYVSETAKWMAQSRQYSRGTVARSTTTTKAMYNAKGYISFRYSSIWMMGGIPNSTLRGATYSLKTGKKANISNVIAGNVKQVKKKIADKVVKKYARNLTVSKTQARKAICSASISQFSFYLKGGKVVVCLEPYTCGLGNVFNAAVTLQGNYT